MKARKVRPLLVRAAWLLEPPQETKPVQSTIRTKKELKVLFNPGTPET
jgi:hypothetical protein